MDSYLGELPEGARYRGDWLKGEIEILELDRTKASTDGVLLRDEFFAVVRDDVLLANGTRSKYLRVIEMPEQQNPIGVVMLPIYAGHIYMVEVFRHATRRWELEAPRGYRDGGRTPIEAALAEIDEELGVGVLRSEMLGPISPNSAVLSGEAVAFWMDLDDSPERDRQVGADAIRAIRALSRSEVDSAVRSGELRDGFTLAALELARVAGLADFNCGLR